MEWECVICGYIHEDDEAPSICPVCGAPASKFVERYLDDESGEGNGSDPEDGDEDEYYGEFQ